MVEMIERLIRYVDDMAGCEFEDASELMLDMFEKYNITLTDGATDKLIEKIKEELSQK